MEVTANATSGPAPIFPLNSTVFGHNKSANFVGYNCLPRNLKCSAKELRKFGALCKTASLSVTWLLQPIGDGDSRHIGQEIAMPAAFEIASDVVTVGRLPQRADIVISVPTVSGLHARIQTTEENLVITDLDSTNGTFIDQRRLQPRVAVAALPGNLITFGDTNLAAFRVCKFERDNGTAEPETSQTKAEDDEPSSNATQDAHLAYF